MMKNPVRLVNRVNFEKELQEKKLECEDMIRKYLPKEEGFAAQLAEAMNYSMEAGGKRLRPILMTMLTTVLAMCTMVFSTDAAAEMSRGMAIVVIGGLLYATLMTLFVVPVLYDILFRREVKKVDIGDEKLLDEKL